MSKAIDALNRLFDSINDLPFHHSPRHKKDYNIVLEKLKALETIKEKQVDIEWLMKCRNVTEYNNGFLEEEADRRLTATEFKNIKGVLKNG